MTSAVDFPNENPTDAEARYSLGLVCKQAGQTSEALKWFQLAADQGHPAAQFELGMMFMPTELLDNQAEALKWIHRAAENGHVEAQLELAYSYASGHMIAEDRHQSLKWFRKAADQGDTNAQYEVGKIYADGIGVRRDLVQAYKWFCLAAVELDPYEAIFERDHLAATLTPKELAQGEKLVRDWHPS